MGKDLKRPWLGRGAATGVFCRACVETKGLVLAPQVGLEPTTLRLTAECLKAASRCKHKTYTRENRVLAEFGGTLGGLLRSSIQVFACFYLELGDSLVDDMGRG